MDYRSVCSGLWSEMWRQINSLLLSTFSLDPPFCSHAVGQVQRDVGLVQPSKVFKEKLHVLQPSWKHKNWWHWGYGYVKPICLSENWCSACILCSFQRQKSSLTLDVPLCTLKWVIGRQRVISVSPSLRVTTTQLSVRMSLHMFFS